MNQQSTILIVDDGVLGRATLETVLRHSGHHLAVAANGPEALTLAAELSPDVILLDVMMPDMDGFEVCRRLRATPRLAEVPIILVTALDDHDSRLRGIEAGADDFISKPFDRIELRARVQTITRLNRYRRLLAARAQFEWVVEQAGDGYLVVRHDDTISYANSQARRYLGLPNDPSEPLRETFLALVRQRYQCEPETAWASWTTQQAQAAPMYLVLPESPTTSAFWIQVDSFDLPGQPVTERLVRMRDVTNQISLQRDMRSFHAMISHKLRTPMVGIFTSLELLDGNHSNLSSEDMVSVAQVANCSARRLHSELEDILQYIQAPALAQRDEGLPLRQLGPIIEEIGASLQLQAIAMAWQTGLDTAQLPLSRRAAELVFWEILENSKKFHPTQTPAIDIFAFNSQPGKIHILIRDDGIALNPRQLAHVWSPYYQAEKHFTGQVDGMGLGLSLVATLIWAVGGTCYFKNRTDRAGIEVNLILPLAQNEQIGSHAGSSTNHRWFRQISR